VLLHALKLNRMAVFQSGLSLITVFSRRQVDTWAQAQIWTLLSRFQFLLKSRELTYSELIFGGSSDLKLRKRQKLFTGLQPHLKHSATPKIFSVLTLVITVAYKFSKSF